MSQTVPPLHGVPAHTNQTITAKPLPPRFAHARKPGDFRLAELSIAERERAVGPSAAGLKRAGLHRPVDIGFETSGLWTQTAEGKSVWRAAIYSPGAHGIRLHVTQFDAGAGTLWLHDASGDNLAGTYTGRGPHNDGDFWTDIVLDETAYLTFEPAANVGATSTLPFRLTEITHILPDALPMLQNGSPAAPASCHLDVTCYPDWADVSKSVGRYLFEQNGDSFLCSGTLLNTRNSSGIPYFLTANHCVSSDAAARTVLMFWLYQTSSCNGQPPSDRDVPRVLGSTLLATLPSTRGDATLLRLPSVPDGVTFSGWTLDAIPDGTTVTGIHHPAGGFKRISFGTLQPPASFTGYALDNFIGAFWDGGGLTEVGSSGSGLFTPNGILFGMLSHGPKFDTSAQYCASIPFADNYGKFTSFYPLIRDFLDDRIASTAPPPVFNPADARALTSGTAVSLDIPAVANPALLGSPNMFRVAVPAGATRLDIRITAAPNANLAIYARLGQLPVVENGKVTADHSDESEGGNKTFSINLQSNPPLRAGTYYIRLGMFSANIRTSATITAIVPTGGGALVSGSPSEYRLGPVAGPTLSGYSYTVTVPQGATKLTVVLATRTINADVDLYVRYGQDVTVSSAGDVVADYKSTGSTGNETIAIGGTSIPRLRPGVYYIKLGMYQPNQSGQGTVTAIIEGAPSSSGGSTQIDTVGTTLLANGQIVNLTIPPSVEGALIRSTRGYRIEVPQGATRLEVKLNMLNPQQDLDLYVRYNQDITIGNGIALADFYSENTSGNESIVITPTSNPPLRAGVYFIAMAVFTPNVTIQATLQATVAGADQAAPNVLTSGQARTFNLPATATATLFNGANGYAVSVPANATQLEIHVNTATPNVNMDVYLRRASDVTLVQGQVQADRSDTTSNAAKSIIVKATDGLREGTYYIALLLYTPNRAVTGTITATIATAAVAPTRTVLTPGRPAAFRIGPTSNARLYNGAGGFSITVPEGVTRVDLRLNTTTPGADVDLYARLDRDVELQDGFAVADYYSERFTGAESISITAASSPPLKPGVYYIALGLFTADVAAEGTITATLTGLSAPAGTPPPITTLTSGVPLRFDLPEVQQPAVFNGDYSYKIVVPPGATQLTVRLNSETPNVDTDLYIRSDADVEVTAANGVTADYASESRLANETIVIDASSSPPLKAGTYYISLSTYTTGARAVGTISATIDRPANGIAISAAKPLASGVPVDFSASAVTAPVLLQGDQAFRIEVPANSASLTIDLKSIPNSLNLDLHVRYGAEPAVVNGRIVADQSSTSATGIEQLIIDGSSLRAGTYFISVSAWTPGVPIRGTLRATVAAIRTLFESDHTQVKKRVRTEASPLLH